MVSNLESIEGKEYNNFSYEELSKQLEQQWNSIMYSTEELKKIRNEMIVKLTNEGFGKTDAINKIIEDHKHLKGFSKSTIYRELEDKREYKQQGGQKLTNVSNRKYENLQEIPKEVENITIPHREEIIQDAQTEPQETTLEIIMPKKQAIKFGGDLKLDAFRLNEKGNVKFIMNDSSLTYELV